jgi:hypothetical protein
MTALSSDWEACQVSAYEGSAGSAKCVSVLDL